MHGTGWPACSVRLLNDKRFLTSMSGNPVLESTRFLVEEPEFVFTEGTEEATESVVDLLAARFEDKGCRLPPWNFPPYYPETDESTPSYFLLGNAINFCYTIFPQSQDVGHDVKFIMEFDGRDYAGSSGMWGCLHRAYKRLGSQLFDGEWLRDLSMEDMEDILRGKTAIPLFEERYQIFREVGRVLCERYDGRFENMVERCKVEDRVRLFNDGNGFVERLAQDFECYDDSVDFEGRVVRFDKRAQLAPAMLYGRALFADESIFPVADLEELTIFANYQIPKILRAKGCTIYREDLAARIDRREEIPFGSRAEMEIRAAAMHKAREITERLRERTGLPVTDAHTDGGLFLLKDQIEGQHHYTLTTRY